MRFDPEAVDWPASKRKGISVKVLWTDEGMYGWDAAKKKVVNFQFFPAGADIDWVGIVPDVVVDQPTETDDDLQLEAARNTVRELIHKKEFLTKQQQGLRRMHEEAFKRSRLTESK